MAGVVVFRNLEQALRAGYQVYQQTPKGYLVRMWTVDGWAIAIVEQR